MLVACYGEEVGNLQIKNLPEDLHRRLRRRAKDAGMTQRDYVLRLIERDLERLTQREWSDLVAQHAPVPGADGAKWVREARDEYEKELDEKWDRLRGGSTPDATPRD
jgi:hypothetical protein